MAQSTNTKGPLIDMEGGALIGQGTYGCIFYPALRCEGEVAHPATLVSKWMTSADAAAEYKQRDLLQRVDPGQEYTLYPMTMCLPAPQTDAERQENPVDTCGAVDLQNVAAARDVRILQFKYGGENLMEIQIPVKDYARFMKSWLNLWEGLIRLHAANVIHADIKLANIVSYPMQTQGTYNTRFIDFGLSFQADTLDGGVEDPTLFSHNYYFCWPYEIRFLNPRYAEHHVSETGIQKWYAQALAVQSNFFPSYLFYGPETGQTLTPAFFQALYRRYAAMSRPQRIAHIAKAADVYALGRALSIKYASMMGHFPMGRGGKVLFLEPEHLHAVSMPADVYSWNTRVAEELSSPFFRWVEQLMHPDPFQRPTARQAAEGFRSLVPLIEHLLRRESSVAKGLRPFFRELRVTNASLLAPESRALTPRSATHIRLPPSPSR